MFFDSKHLLCVLHHYTYYYSWCCYCWWGFCFDFHFNDNGNLAGWKFISRQTIKPPPNIHCVTHSLKTISTIINKFFRDNFQANQLWKKHFISRTKFISGNFFNFFFWSIKFLDAFEMVKMNVLCVISHRMCKCAYILLSPDFHSN